MRNEPNLRVDPYRISRPDFPDSSPGKNHGCFQVGPLRVISSGSDNETGWEHVSISCLSRTPFWAEMEKVKQLFWGDKQTVIQFHPLETEYVNTHPNCLHLWRMDGTDHPLPPTVLV